MGPRSQDILRRALKEKAGWVERPPERTVLFFGADTEVAATVDAVVAGMRDRYGRLQFAFVTGGAAQHPPLMQRWPGALVFRAPWRNHLSALLFLLTSRARMIVALRTPAHLDPILAQRAYSLGIPIAVVEAGAQADDARLARLESPSLLSRVDLFVPRDQEASAALRLRGIPAERIAFEEAPGGAARRTAATVEALAPLVGRRPPVRRPLQRAVVAGLDRPTPRHLLGVRVKRIESLAALRAALGDPQIIMCLGNGPSSESPDLLTMAYDSLFRVNHRWRRRGFLTRPHLVFTGSKRTLFSLSGPIFAFQTTRTEAHLVTHQVFNPLCRRMRFVTLERIGVLEAIDEGGLRPSNGAAMLATAVALQPRKLIVAGIDLFQHPEGSYPGDSQSPNAYVPAHDRGIEIDFITRQLDAYRGELVVVGEVLARHLQVRRQRIG